MARQASDLLALALREREELGDELLGRLGDAGVSGSLADDLLASLDAAFPCPSGEDWIARLVGGDAVYRHGVATVAIALGSVKLDDAIELLEAMNPERLRGLVDRVAVADFLTHPATPCLTLAQLAELTGRFIQLLEAEPEQGSRVDPVELYGTFPWLAERVGFAHSLKRRLYYENPGLRPSLAPLPVGAVPDFRGDL